MKTISEAGVAAAAAAHGEQPQKRFRARAARAAIRVSAAIAETRTRTYEPKNTKIYTLRSTHGVEVEEEVHVGSRHHALEQGIAELLRGCAVLLARHDAVQVRVLGAAALVSHVPVGVCDDDGDHCPGKIIAVELLEQPAAEENKTQHHTIARIRRSTTAQTTKTAGCEHTLTCV
jgi:hypothetical protein